MADAEIKTILTANTVAFEAGLKQAVDALKKAEGKFSTSNKSIGKQFQSLGRDVRTLAAAFAVREIIAYGSKLIDAAGQLKDLSQQSGIAASTLSALRVVLEQGGSNVDEFAGSVVKMNKAISEAATGSNKGLLKTFDELGLSVTKLKQLAPQDQFFEVAAALGKVKDQGDFTRLGMDVFGKSFRALAPAIRETNGNLSEYVSNAQAAGNALTDAQVDRLDALGDAITKLGIVFENALSGSLADFLTFLDNLDARTKRVLATISKAASSSLIPGSGLVIGGAGDALSKNGEQFGPPRPAAASRASGNNSNIPDLEKAASNAEKLRDALSKLQRQTSRDIYTDGLTPLEEKLAEVDFTVEDLARQYKTKLTPELRHFGETAKENIKNLDKLQKTTQLAKDLGGAFTDAFSDAADGAQSFGDSLANLGKSIERILFKSVVGQPLEDFFTGLLKSGGGGILGSILPSYATGVSNVPYDQIARLHKGETVITRQATDSMGGGGNNITVNVVNNTPAQVKTKRSGDGSLTVMIDNAVAQNMTRAGSKTNQALRVQGNRTLVRR